MEKINAQEEMETAFEKPPTFQISLTPSSLLHLRLSGVMGGVEYRFHEKWSIVNDFGYTYQNLMRERRQKGFRNRTEIRWYPGEYDPSWDFFMGAQFRYWQVSFDDEGTFCRAGCQYFEDLEFSSKQNGIGGSFVFGIGGTMGKNFYYEFGAALGLIQRNNNPDVPEDAEPIAGQFLFSRLEGEKYTQEEPVLLGWIKIKYTLF